MVEIPDDVAKAIADDLRRITAPSNDEARLSRKAWADLLDPKPPSLREQVAEALGCSCEWRGTPATCPHLTYADAVLAVVADAPIEQLIALVGPRFADWLAAQPLPPVGGNFRPAYVDQRGHDVRLLRVRHDPSATTDGGAG